MCEIRENIEHRENPALSYFPDKGAKKTLRQKRKMRGIAKGRAKAAKFFDLVFFNTSYALDDIYYRRYRGIFTKTRDGRFFNKERDWNNKRIAMLNKYLWMTEARENREHARIFVRKAKGLR